MSRTTFYQLLELSFVQPKEPAPVTAHNVCIKLLGYFQTVDGAKRECALQGISVVKEDIYPYHMVSDEVLAEWFYEEANRGTDRSNVWAIARPMEVTITGELDGTHYFPVSYEGPQYDAEILLGPPSDSPPVCDVVIDVHEMDLPGHPGMPRRAARMGALGI